MEIVISDTNIFIDLWNIGLLERFCELPVSIHTILQNNLLSKEEYVTKLKTLLESNHRLPIKEIMKRIEDSL